MLTTPWAWINCSVRMFMVILVSTSIFQLAHHYEAEPLLACVTMGVIVVNRR